MTNHDSQTFWKEIANSYHTLSLASSVNFNKYNEIADLLLKMNPESIVDYGCGSCILESLLIKNGFRGKIYAIDGSQHMLKIAKKNLEDKQNVIFLHHDLNTSIPEEIKNVDAAVAVNTIFLLNNMDRFIKKVSHQIKRGGIFIIVEPHSGPIKVGRILAENYRNLTLAQSIAHTIRMIVSIKHFVKMYFYQRRIDQLAKKNIIRYTSPHQLINLLDTRGLYLYQYKNVQADQNYLLVARKATIHDWSINYHYISTQSHAWLGGD